jgi:hypothetical protein
LDAKSSRKIAMFNVECLMIPLSPSQKIRNQKPKTKNSKNLDKNTKAN